MSTTELQGSPWLGCESAVEEFRDDISANHIGTNMYDKTLDKTYTGKPELFSGYSGILALKDSYLSLVYRLNLRPELLMVNVIVVELEAIYAEFAQQARKLRSTTLGLLGLPQRKRW